MATRILEIPQTAEPLNFETRTNTSWIDAFAIVIAGDAAGYGVPGNAGAATITVSAVAPQATLGSHVVRIIEDVGLVQRFTVTDPVGALTGIGTIGATMLAGGITFTLVANADRPAVGDTFVIGVLPRPLDLTGIEFDLMARRYAGGPVLLTATTRTMPPTIVNGGTGGQIAMRVSEAVMQALAPDTYTYDLVASADDRRVLVRSGVIAHVQGSTFPII